MRIGHLEQIRQQLVGEFSIAEKGAVGFALPRTQVQLINIQGLA